MEDKKLTLKVGLSLLSIDAKLHDHIIIGDSYYSMAEAGIIEIVQSRIRELITA